MDAQRTLMKEAEDSNRGILEHTKIIVLDFAVRMRPLVWFFHFSDLSLFVISLSSLVLTGGSPCILQAKQDDINNCCSSSQQLLCIQCPCVDTFWYIPVTRPPFTRNVEAGYIHWHCKQEGMKEGVTARARVKDLSLLFKDNRLTDASKTSEEEQGRAKIFAADFTSQSRAISRFWSRT